MQGSFGIKNLCIEDYRLSNGNLSVYNDMKRNLVLQNIDSAQYVEQDLNKSGVSQRLLNIIYFIIILSIKKSLG